MISHFPSVAFWWRTSFAASVVTTGAASLGAPAEVAMTELAERCDPFVLPTSTSASQGGFDEMTAVTAHDRLVSSRLGQPYPVCEGVVEVWSDYPRYSTPGHNFDRPIASGAICGGEPDWWLDYTGADDDGAAPADPPQPSPATDASLLSHPNPKASMKPKTIMKSTRLHHDCPDSRYSSPRHHNGEDPGITFDGASLTVSRGDTAPELGASLASDDFQADSASGRTSSTVSPMHADGLGGFSPAQAGENELDQHRPHLPTLGVAVSALGTGSMLIMAGGTAFLVGRGPRLHHKNQRR